MKKLLLAILVAAMLVGAVSSPAHAGQCGLPNAKPLWIDFADGSTPFWKMFAQPNIVVAAANFIYPPRIRAGGAKTIYWDMYLNSRRVGTPDKPADPADVVKRAHRLFDYAVASSQCETPWMAENELFGASLPTPWSPTNVQYRANVLLYLRTLASRGARPFLLVSSAPYTYGEAADWWRQVAQVADIVREVYFPAPAIWAQGPVVGSRMLRLAFRKGISDFTSIGIPVTKLGLMLGFHTEAGTGGREGLKPAQAWFETVKWQTLAAKQVGKELRFATTWSWGWANWGERGYDEDKPGAACVWLWARNPKLCNGPRMAGAGFDASTTVGQLRLPRGARCTLGSQAVWNGALSALTRVTGDRQVAYSALFSRAAESSYRDVDTREILAAERMVVAQRFGGSFAGYRAALARSGATLAVARGIIGDELRRAEVAERFHPRAPTAAQISDYYLIHADVLARPVRATPAPAWLGGRKEGFALASVAPPQVFTLATGRKAKVRSLGGPYAVKPMGNARPLRLVPLAVARSAIAAALAQIARENAFQSWSVTQQRSALRRAVCSRDELPGVSEVRLTSYLPFLELA